MGIPSYFSYIVKNHSNIIKKLSSNTIQVNNLYLDCNSIIYDAVHNIDFTKLVESDADTIIRNVCSKIDEYVKELIESESAKLICSHNPILPKIAEKLIGKKSFKSLKKELAPGDAIVIHFRDGDAVALDWINAPSNLAI